MGASKEYYLKMSEEQYSELPDMEKIYLGRLGMQVRQLPTDDDLQSDQNYQKIRKHRIDAWNAEQEYLFKKRNLSK